MLHAHDESVRAHLLEGGFGLEKESLRIDGGGFLAHTPADFADDVHIVRDFSENQVEVNTPVCATPAEAIQSLEHYNGLVQRAIANLPERELLWPFSNPPYILNEKDIPIAQYFGDDASKTEYREYLSDRYGRYKMAFSGIHLNYSFGEALLRADKLENADLSCLKGVFCGGDSLSIELKKKVDDFLKAHNASVQIRQGYGLTECVTASCLTPKDYNRVGSIGVPFPDTYYKIVKPGTTEELDANFEGEICISGPSVMLRYVDNPEETANTLRRHEDGRIWLHTGDLGKMDEDGFVFFSQRMKRMIITSGYNVYPGQLENIIDGHEKVLLSCVIGVKDPYKVQKVKAFVVLRPGFEANDETKKELLDYCRQHIAKYAMPYDIEFRDELPKTLVGKVAYRILEEEEADRQATQEALQAAQEASENK